MDCRPPIRQASHEPRGIAGRAQERLPQRRIRGAFIGLSFACAFAAAAAYHIDRPGLYYDELHQAPAAFAYVGKPSAMFSIAPIAGIPTMNMPYSGAIKSAIYGSYLRITGRSFTPRSWRLLGIGFATLGILAFYALVGSRIPFAARIVFGLLLVSDSNLTLQAAYDWGPVSLAFLLRMLFLGLWVRSVFDIDGSRHRTWFWMGLFVGISIFEKLSSTVLLGPLAICLLTSRGVSARRVANVLTGLFLGVLPVLAINVVTLVTQSLLLFTLDHSSDATSVLGYATHFSQVAVGALERLFIFGLPTPPWIGTLEMLGLGTVCVTTAWMATRSDHDNRLAREAAVTLACYLIVGVCLRLLPAATAENHWIIGTPFQYLAIAFAVVPLFAAERRWGSITILATMGLVLMAVARIASAMATYAALRGDHFRPDWDPSVTVAARLLADLPPGAAVVAADWGIATQVFSLSNGRQQFVYEPFWDPNPSAVLSTLTGDPTNKLIALVTLRPRAGVRPDATRLIFDYMYRIPAWREVPFDSSGKRLSSVEIHAFQRVPSLPAGSSLHP